jgi:hypothetical protein
MNHPIAQHSMQCFSRPVRRKNPCPWLPPCSFITSLDDAVGQGSIPSFNKSGLHSFPGILREKEAAKRRSSQRKSSTKNTLLDTSRSNMLSIDAFDWRQIEQILAKPRMVLLPLQLPGSGLLPALYEVFEFVTDVFADIDMIMHTNPNQRPTCARELD